MKNVKHLGRRVLSLVLVLMLCMGLIGTNVFAASSSIKVIVYIWDDFSSYGSGPQTPASKGLTTRSSFDSTNVDLSNGWPPESTTATWSGSGNTFTGTWENRGYNSGTITLPTPDQLFSNYGGAKQIKYAKESGSSFNGAQTAGNPYRMGSGDGTGITIYLLIYGVQLKSDNNNNNNNNNNGGGDDSDGNGSTSQDVSNGGSVLHTGKVVYHSNYPNSATNYTYTVNYNVNAFNGFTTTSHTVYGLKGSTYTPQVSFKAPAGYKAKTPKLWTTNKDGTGDSYNPGEKRTLTFPKNGDNGTLVDLYAQWDIDATPVKLTYNYLDDTNSTLVENYYAGVNADLKL